MTWRFVEKRQPEAAPKIPDPKAVSFATDELNSIVFVLVFEAEDGRRQEVPLTVMMMLRADKLQVSAEDYAARLLGFNDLVAA